MDSMLMVVAVAGGQEPYVFVVKRPGEKEFHLPRKALEHDSLVPVSVGDFLGDVFLREEAVPLRVCFIPNLTDRGLPVRAAVVPFREREEPVCKKEVGVFEWVSVASVLGDQGDLRLEATSRYVIRQVFAVQAEGVINSAPAGTAVVETA